MCTGSCIAPILSNIYFTHHDRDQFSLLGDSTVVKCFSLVDNFPVILDCTKHVANHLVLNTRPVFGNCLAPLVLTHELAANGCKRFLDFLLNFLEDSFCWLYKSSRINSLLASKSAHSKLLQ